MDITLTRSVIKSARRASECYFEPYSILNAMVTSANETTGLSLSPIRENFQNIPRVL